MADWLTLRVVLLGQPDAPLSPPPGRILLARADHTLADVAEAVDTAFGRWDLTPISEVTVGDRRIVSDPGAGDEATDAVALGDLGLSVGDSFTYVFDVGEGWTHDCEIEAADVDPLGLYGDEPELPVPVFGWGTVPDQYGRDREPEDEEVEALEALTPAAPEALLEVDQADDPAEAEAEAEDLEDDDEGELDELEEAAAWEAARQEAWSVVAVAVAEVDRRRDDGALARVGAELRRHAADAATPWGTLWAAADLDGDLPDDDEALWVALAAAVVEPAGELPIDVDVEAAWAALEPADWAGAVIELTRAGIGQAVEPSALVELVERCPEIEGPELSDEDVEALEQGFAPVVELWTALGVVDRRGRLTALGRWGLPESLQRAWVPDV